MFIDKKGNEKVIVDVSFPPNKDSLLGKAGAITKFKVWEDYMWMSPSAFYLGNFYTVSVSITPGKLNCNLSPKTPMLAAIAAFAMNPSRLEGMITQTKGDGIFHEVRLCNDGEIVPVKVDYYFPHDSLARKYVFIHSEAREIWAMLIEKACAKSYGSYQYMTLKLQKEPLTAAFRLLTGYPTDIVKHEDKDDLLKKIKDANKKEYPIIATTGTIQCVIMEIIQVVKNSITKNKVKVMMWDESYISQNPEFERIEGNDGLKNTYLISFDDFFTKFAATGINKYEPKIKYIKAINFAAPETAESSSSTTSPSNLPLARGLMSGGELHFFGIKVTTGYEGFIKVLEKGLRDSKTRYGVLVGFKEEEGKEIEYVAHRLYSMEKMITIELQSKKAGWFYCLVRAEKKKSQESELKIVVQDNSESKNLREITGLDMLEYTLISMVKGYVKAKGVENEVSKGVFEYTFKNCLNILTGKYFVNNSGYQLLSTAKVKNGPVDSIPPSSSDEITLKVDPGNSEFLCFMWKGPLHDPEISWKTMINKTKEDIIKEIEEGKLSTTNKEELAPGVFFVTYEYDCGVLLAIKNTTKHMLYKGSHDFTINNLSLKEEKIDEDELKTIVTPDSTFYLNAKIIDTHKPVYYTFKHISTIETSNELDQKIIDELMLTGEEKKLGEKCYAWTKMISDHWCMYLTNDSPHIAKITIQVVKVLNLKCENEEKWQYVLKSKAVLLKRVQSINALNVSSCVWKYVCEFIK